MKYYPIKLNFEGTKKVFSGGLWLTLKDTLEGERLKEKIEPGSLVTLLTKEGHFLAQAYFNPKVYYCIKILTKNETPIDKEFFKRIFQKSFEIRKKLYPSEEVFRLIHGEGDFLPGLIVDIYKDVAVLQFHTLGMENLKEAILSGLREALSFLKGFFLKNDFEKRKEENLPQYVEFIGENKEDPLFVEMDGIKFLIPLEKGQKTGFFLDQRENRRILMKFSKDFIIFDGFSYIGGFSLYALKGGAKRAYLFDRSGFALDLAIEIAKINGWKNKIIPVEGDIFQILRNPPTEGDILILDPPAFIKAKKDKEKGMKKYEDLYYLGLRYFQNRKGFLFLFSCSHFLSLEEQKFLIKKILSKINLKARILKYLFQAPDHPINPLIEETEYLKGLLLKID